MDRAEAGGVVDELHQEAVLPRVAVVDPKPRVYPAATGLETDEFATIIPLLAHTDDSVTEFLRNDKTGSNLLLFFFLDCLVKGRRSVVLFFPKPGEVHR